MNVARYRWPVVRAYQRRLMLVLLIGTLNGTGLPLDGAARVARVRAGQAARVAARLESLGWAESFTEHRTDGRPPRRLHILADGGERVAELLGLLQAGTAREAVTQ